MVLKRMCWSLAAGSSRLNPDFIGKAGFELPEGSLDLDALYRRIIEQALAKHLGNQTAAARYLAFHGGFYKAG